MSARTGYFNRTIGKWANSSFDTEYSDDALPYITRRELLQFTLEVLENNSSGATVPSTTWASGGPYSFRFFIDNDYVNYYNGSLQTAITAGAITEIKIDSLAIGTATVLSTGRIRLTNSSNQTESFDYTSFTLLSGVYTFTVSATAANSYSVSDLAQVVEPSLIEVQSANINQADAAQGKLVITMDADNEQFIAVADALGTAEIQNCQFELQVLDATPRIVDTIGGVFRCLNLLVDDFGNPPAGPISNYYTKSEADARFEPIFKAANESTIASGAITPTQNVITIDTEGDAATDDLVTINTSSYTGILFARAENTARTVVIKQTGNIETGGDDITLDDTNRYVQFWYDTVLSKWVVVGVGGGIDFNALLEIGGAIDDSDEIIVSDVSDSGVVKKSLLSRVWTYISGKIQSLGFTFDLNMNSNKITALSPGTAGTDAVNKDQLDGVAQGVAFKANCDLATTANISLSGEQTIDGVLTSSSRVLVKDQTDQTQNGYYDTAAGAWTRTSDMDSNTEFVGATCYISLGTVNANKQYRCTNVSNPTIGSTNITFDSIAVSTDHNSTTGKQGGTASEYYHLTNTEHSRLSPVSAFGATLIDDADAAAATTTLGSPTGKANLTTQYRGVFVSSSGEVTESTTVTTDASGNLDVAGEVDGNTAKFGSATNYSEFEADGTLEFVGDATVHEDININPINLWRNAGSNPDIIGIPGTNIEVCSFDASSVEEISFGFEMPHSTKLGADLSMHVHWSPTNTNTGVVRWGLEYNWFREPGAPFSDTNIWNETISTDSTGFNGFSTRVVLPNASLSGSGDQLSVTFKAGSGGADIVDAYIGNAAASGDAYDFDGNQVQLLFSGIGTASIGSNATLQSDFVSLPTIDLSTDVVISFRVSGNDDWNSSTTSSANTYFKSTASSESSQTDVTGYTLDSGRNTGIQTVTIRDDSQPVTSSTTIYSNDTANGVAWQKQTAGFAAITPPLSELGLQFCGRLFRDATNAADTYNADAAITMTFGGHYEIDTVGSRQILVK